MEEWKPIKGYEGIYEVSSWGRVRSLDRLDCRGRVKHGFMLKLSKSTPGYYIVHLQKDGKAKTVQVHRLVAMAFIPNPDNLPFINHKDETRTNNRVENLEWCTPQYNLRYGTYQERRAVISSRIVEELKDGKVVATFANLKDAARSVGCSDVAIGYVCRGKQQSVRGRMFRYQK